MEPIKFPVIYYDENFQLVDTKEEAYWKEVRTGVSITTITVDSEWPDNLKDAVDE